MRVYVITHVVYTLALRPSLHSYFHPPGIYFIGTWTLTWSFMGLSKYSYKYVNGVLSIATLFITLVTKSQP